MAKALLMLALVAALPVAAGVLPPGSNRVRGHPADLGVRINPTPPGSARAIAFPETLEVSLEEALRRALTGSPSLRIATLEQRQAQARKRAADRARLPSLSGSASYQEASTAPEMSLEEMIGPGVPLPPGMGDASIRMGDRDVHDAHVELRAPLWTGGKISSARRAAGAAMKAAAAARSREAANLALEVVKAYFRLVKAFDAISVSEASLAYIERLREDVVAMMREGLSTREESLAVEARLAAARVDLLSSRFRAAQAAVALSSLMGIEPGAMLEPASPPEVLEDLLGPEALSLYVRGRKAEPPETIERHPALAAARSAVQAARHRLEGAVAERFPSLALNARGGYGRPGLDPMHNEWQGYWTAAVGLSWKLWDWGARDARIEEARAALDEAKERLRAARLAVLAGWQRSRLELMEARERAEMAEAAWEASAAHLEAVRGRFGQGLSTTREVLEAEADEARAHLRVLAARADVQSAIAAYEEASGLLAERVERLLAQAGGGSGGE